MPDAVNPDHYKRHPSGVECIDVVEHMGFNLGNVVKYIWRAGLKHDVPVEDLRKARWYLDREIEKREGEAEEVAAAVAIDPAAPAQFKHGYFVRRRSSRWHGGGKGSPFMVTAVVREVDQSGDARWFYSGQDAKGRRRVGFEHQLELAPAP